MALGSTNQETTMHLAIVRDEMQHCRLKIKIMNLLPAIFTVLATIDIPGSGENRKPAFGEKVRSSCNKLVNNSRAL
jgi:hypothetical protein